MQKLFGIALAAQSASTLLDRSPAQARGQVERLQELAQDAIGYSNLCRLITDAHMLGVPLQR